MADYQPFQSPFWDTANLLGIKHTRLGVITCAAQERFLQGRCKCLINLPARLDACTILLALPRLIASPVQLRDELPRLAKILVCHDARHQDQASQIADRWFLTLVNHANRPTCSICFNDLVTKPVRTPCGHAFCGECIERWFATRTAAGRRKTCPMCRARLRFDELISIPQIVSRAGIEDRDVWALWGCPSEKQGEWIILLNLSVLAISALIMAALSSVLYWYL